MKKKNVYIVLTVLILSLCFIFVACNGDNSPAATPPGGNNDPPSGQDPLPEGYYTVTFDSQGGSAVESQQVLEGNPATMPAVPTHGKDVFQGWYKSPDENAELWDFNIDRVNSNITLYAHWKSAEVQEPISTLVFELNEAGTGYIVTGDNGQNERIIIPNMHDELPVVQIGNDAFAYSKHLSNITYVYIPDSVTEIGRNAFYSRQSDLVTVEIGQNSQLQKIGANAFSGARLLESIYIPASVTEIGDSAFNNCGSLENIDVASGNEVYKSENGHLIERSTDTLIRGGSNPIIPNGVKIIGEAAFSFGKQATLIIPTSVESMKMRAITDSVIESIIFMGTEEQWDVLLSNSSKMWDMSKKNLPVTFRNGEEYEVEAPGAGPQIASNIKSVNGVPLLMLNNGVQMPQFGLGTQIQSLERGDQTLLNETSRAAVISALNAGYRHLDDAHGYRQERGVGCGILDSGVSRNEIWITDKLWPSEYADAENAIDAMLARLGVDYIDLVYLHHPAGTLQNIRNAWRALEKAYRQGKIRALGISNFDNRMDAFNAIMQEEIKPQVMQIECHPFAQRLETRRLAEQYNIQVECWYPLGHGDQRLLNAGTLGNIAAAHDKSVVQVIIRWHIQEGFSVIPGSTDPAHIAENIDVFDFELTDEEMALIRSMDQGEDGRYYTLQYDDSLWMFGAIPDWNGTFADDPIDLT